MTGFRDDLMPTLCRVPDRDESLRFVVSRGIVRGRRSCVAARQRCSLMRITQEVRAFAIEQAGRRCECTGKDCRHHLRGARCKRGLRGDQWKVFWRTESGGATRDNIEAWCLECFANNFAVPRETVALFASDVVDYARLIEEDHWRAITMRSILRDAAVRVSSEHNGRAVLGRRDDDVLMEFPTSQDAVETARHLSCRFQEVVARLGLPIPELCGAIHCGEVTRWRNGLLAGDAVELTTTVRDIAGVGQVLLTEPAAAPLRGTIDLEPITADAASELSPGGIWALRL
jgi:class 3 adenylate cyclase